MIAKSTTSDRFTGQRPNIDSITSVSLRRIKVSLGMILSLGRRDLGTRVCPNCNGTGIILGWDGSKIPTNPVAFKEPCRRCIGTGKKESLTNSGLRSITPNRHHLWDGFAATGSDDSAISSRRLRGLVTDDSGR